MAKSTISTGPFPIAMVDITRGYRRPSHRRPSKSDQTSPGHLPHPRRFSTVEAARQRAGRCLNEENENLASLSTFKNVRMVLKVHFCKKKKSTFFKKIE